MPNIINEVVVNGNTYGLPGSGTLSNLATIESNASAASKAYAIGDHLVLNDVYYVVTAAIAHNDALLVGTNISVAKAGDEISQLNNDLTDYSVNTPLRNVTYYNGKLYQITSTGQRGSEIVMNSIPKYVVAALGYGTVRPSTLTHVISNNTTKTSNVYHGQLNSSAIDTRYLTIEASSPYYTIYTMVKDALFYPNNEPVPVVLKAGKSIQIGYNASGSAIDAATGTFAWVE